MKNNKPRGGAINFRVEITCSGIRTPEQDVDEEDVTPPESNLRFRYKWLTAKKTKPKKTEPVKNKYEEIQTDFMSKWERVYVMNSPPAEPSSDNEVEEEEPSPPDGFKYEKTFSLSAGENTPDFARTFTENSRLFFFVSDETTSYSTSEPFMIDISGFLADRTNISRVFRDSNRFSFVRIRVVTDRVMLSEKDRNKLNPLSITIRQCHRLPGARLDMNDLSQRKYAVPPNDRFSLLREHCSEAYV